MYICWVLDQSGFIHYQLNMTVNEGWTWQLFDRIYTKGFKCIYSMDTNDYNYTRQKLTCHNNENHWFWKKYSCKLSYVNVGCDQFSIIHCNRKTLKNFHIILRHQITKPWIKQINWSRAWSRMEMAFMILEF